jgi:hypothetical protein
MKLGRETSVQATRRGAPPSLETGKKRYAKVTTRAVRKLHREPGDE